jgi:hypothetical protein
MARLRAPLRVALLILLALLIALGATAPAFGADVRDPRCDAWEAALTPPPGINLRTLCPTGDVTTEAVNLESEPLLPYVVGLIVMAVVLGAFGVIAVRMTAPRTERRRPGADWWACPSCGVRNGPDRTTCFACQASRADAPPTPVDARPKPETTPPAEDPHPA